MVIVYVDKSWIPAYVGMTMKTVSELCNIYRNDKEGEAGIIKKRIFKEDKGA